MDPGGPNNPPADPPMGGGNDDHYHHDSWHPWLNLGVGLGSYGGGPVIVEQPVVVQQPVVVEQGAITVEAASLTKVPVGATITLHGKDFGMEMGRVGLLSGELMLAANVTNWSNDSVTLVVPQLALAGPAKAKFVVFRADGSVASEVPCELVLGQMQ